MSEPIRVLEVVAKMNLAGTETMLMNFYRNIDREKIQFDFAMCTEEHCDYEDEILSMGGKIIRYPQYRGYNHISYKKWWNSFFQENPQYKIVHGHIGSTAAIYLRIAKKHGCYTIAHSHGTLEPLSLRSIIWRMYSYPTRYVADYFMGCSFPALETRYGYKIACNKGKARVLNNSIDAIKYKYNPAIRDIVRKELGIASDECVLGTVGRLSAPKNPHMTLDIIEELKSKGVKFKFLWAGDGELRNTIEDEISKRNLTDIIYMLGLRNDISSVLQAMNIFIFPSIWEGLGIACVEAQAAGLPTFCSDVIPKEAKVSDLCTFLPLSDTKIWCQEIIKCIEQISKDTYNRPNTYNEVVRAGYDIHSVAEWLQDFYEKKHYGD